MSFSKMLAEVMGILHSQQSIFLQSRYIDRGISVPSTKEYYGTLSPYKELELDWEDGQRSGASPSLPFATPAKFKTQ